MKKQLLKLSYVVGLVSFLLIIQVTRTNAQKVSPGKDVKTLSHKVDLIMELDADTKVNTKSYKAGDAIVTELVDQYLFPSDLDNSGDKVVIQPFGNTEESYLWTKDGGITTFEGKGTSLSTRNTIAGSFTNTNFPGGLTVGTAGYWDIETQEWTFLGVNPSYPNVGADGYNDAWGQSVDGEIIVGMQWYEDWSVTAFKWTEMDGYINIGDSLSNSSRASGVSRNGEVVFGWNATDMGYWSPVIWKNDSPILLDPDMDGEVMCASDEGTYVAGQSNGSAFYWSEDEGMVSFGTDMDFPTVIREDGSIFGFNGIFPPTVRQAFYRDSLGNVSSFNDYAEARGMLNAQDWSFYSVNNVSMNGNRFIGAGVNPNGQDVCFLIEFTDVVEIFSLNLSANPVEGGEVIGSGDFEVGSTVDIEAVANENYVFTCWTNIDGDTISLDAATSITMPENDLELIANFNSTIGIESYGFANIEVSPNPTNGIVKIDYHSLGKNDVNLNVYSSMGELIESKVVNQKGSLFLDLTNYAAGVYLVKLYNGSSVEIIKVMKRN